MLLFKYFSLVNDLEIEHNSAPVLYKSADDSTLVAPSWNNYDTLS